MEFPVKVAVATKEGKAVSEHFGDAKRFAIGVAAHPLSPAHVDWATQ